jgi:hypothetical protein
MPGKILLIFRSSLAVFRNAELGNFPTHLGSSYLLPPPSNLCLCWVQRRGVGDGREGHAGEWEGREAEMAELGGL